MENAKIQAFAKRYTAALINTAPPNEVDLSGEGFTHSEEPGSLATLDHSEPPSRHRAIRF